MKFFFPDSQDQIDPSFDFTTEQRSIYRVRQRDDRYAHEALSSPPFDGFLVSKTIVDGLPGAAGKYTIAQRHRLYRVGIREFFRLDDGRGPRLETMGDCGAFSYVREDDPPYSPDEVIDFYERVRLRPRHLGRPCHLGLRPRGRPRRPSIPRPSSLARPPGAHPGLAAEFLRRCRARKVGFEPLGVAQGWSPASYASAVQALAEDGLSAHRPRRDGARSRPTRSWPA